MYFGHMGGFSRELVVWTPHCGGTVASPVGVAGTIGTVAGKGGWWWY